MGCKVLTKMQRGCYKAGMPRGVSIHSAGAGDRGVEVLFEVGCIVTDIQNFRIIAP